MRQNRAMAQRLNVGLIGYELVGKAAGPNAQPNQTGPRKTVFGDSA